MPSFSSIPQAGLSIMGGPTLVVPFPKHIFLLSLHSLPLLPSSHFKCSCDTAASTMLVPDPINGGLGESVSFGRFAVDSVSWVKRSSFNHNQYLEELGSCSMPGSVRQKKAYFDAYYKAIAKRKALENALPEGNGDGQNNGQSQEHASTIHMSDVSDAGTGDPWIDPSAANAEFSQDNSLAKSLAQEERIGSLSPSIIKGHEELNAEAQGPVSEGASQGLNAEQPQESPGSSGTFEKEEEPVLVSEEHREYTFLVPNVHDLEEENAHSLQDEQEELVPQRNSVAHADKVDDIKHTEIIVKFEADAQRHEAHVTSDWTESPDKHTDMKVNTDKKVIQKPFQSVVQTPKGKPSHSTVNVASKSARLSDGKVDRKKGLEGAVKMKIPPRLNTINTCTNVTVPQPFALVTGKRASLIGDIHEEDGKRFARKPACNNPSSSPALKKTQASKMENKYAGGKSLYEGNIKLRKEPEQLLESPNEFKQDTVEQNSVALHAQTRNAGRGRPSDVKNNAKTIYLKSDLQAEKRKQFNPRPEAKLNAKEAEKNQAEAKTQEEAVEEVKQLRKVLNCKATPMPNFTQESIQPKMDSKKAGIPTTRAKSPKLGRKRNGIVNSDSTSGHLSSSKQGNSSRSESPASFQCHVQGAKSCSSLENSCPHSDTTAVESAANDIKQVVVENSATNNNSNDAKGIMASLDGQSSWNGLEDDMQESTSNRQSKKEENEDGSAIVARKDAVQEGPRKDSFCQNGVVGMKHKPENIPRKMHAKSAANSVKRAQKDGARKIP